MEVDEAASAGFGGQSGRPAFKMLKMRRGDPGAIASSHQHTILGLAQVGDVHGEPYSDRRQRDGKGEGGHIGQHAVAEIIGFVITGAFVTRQVVRLVIGLLLYGLMAKAFPPARRMRQRPRSEFDHAMLLVRCDGLLDLHCCQLRDNLMQFSMLAARFTSNVDMAGMR
jgi:hypothetical protein